MLKNTRMLSVGIIISLLAVMVAGYVYHCLLMGNAYMAHKELFRTPEAASAFYPIHVLANIILVSISTLMFAKGYENKGYMEGFRFGLLIAFILCSHTLVGYVYSPIPDQFLQIWLIGNLIEGVVIGLSLALAFKLKFEDKPARKARPAKKSRKK